MININNRPMTPYKMAIRNVSLWLKSQSEIIKDQGSGISIFHAAPVLAAAFAMNQKNVIEDLININEIE